MPERNRTRATSERMASRVDDPEIKRAILEGGAARVARVNREKRSRRRRKGKRH